MKGDIHNRHTAVIRDCGDVCARVSAHACVYVCMRVRMREAPRCWIGWAVHAQSRRRRAANWQMVGYHYSQSSPAARREPAHKIQIDVVLTALRMRVTHTGTDRLSIGRYSPGVSLCLIDGQD